MRLVSFYQLRFFIVLARFFVTFKWNNLIFNKLLFSNINYINYLDYEFCSFGEVDLRYLEPIKGKVITNNLFLVLSILFLFSQIQTL